MQQKTFWKRPLLFLSVESCLIFRVILNQKVQAYYNYYEPFENEKLFSLPAVASLKLSISFGDSNLFG